MGDNDITGRGGGGGADGSNKYVERDENDSKCDNNIKYR